MISKRAIEIKLREMIPEGTHIRSGTINRIQFVLDCKTKEFLGKIVNVASLNDPMVITKEVVDKSFVDVYISGDEHQ